MTTITQTISTLDPVPSRDDPDNFDAEADQFLGKLPQLRTELNTFSGQVNTVAGEVNANAAAAAGSATQANAAKVDAQSAVTAAAAVAGAAKWVAGTNYAQGVCVWSPLDGLPYRRTGAAGVSNTDPKNDAANWKAQVAGVAILDEGGNVVTIATSINLVGDAVIATAAGGAVTITINAPTVDDAWAMALAI